MTNDSVSIGNRMQIARNYIGKTRVDVAQLLGINHSTYADYETGRRSTDGKLNVIADILCVTEAFLNAGPINVVSAQELSYRKLVSLKSASARHVQACAAIASEIVSIQNEFMALPLVTVPFVALTEKTSIEEVALEIRSQLGMSDSPLRSALDLVEYYGVSVFWVFGDDQFDGVSFWNCDRPFILLNLGQRDGYRTRFTLLHELAHLVMHRSWSGVDRLEDERRVLDREANRFASSFLLPPNSFARRFPRFGSLNEILEERRYWQTSCAALVRRAKDLNLIDEHRYRQLCVGISAKGWRKGEPGSPMPAESKVHRFFLDEAGEKGLTSRLLASRLKMKYEMFREMVPTADEYQELTCIRSQILRPDKYN